MRKSLFFLLFIALIPFTEVSAKKIRYSFNNVEISSTPDDIRNVRGTYIIELDTDNQTVFLKFKSNGSNKWDSIKMDIKYSGIFSESPDSETKSYESTDGSVNLYISFNTIHKYTENVSLHYYYPSKGRIEYMSFGKPTKVERF